MINFERFFVVVQMKPCKSDRLYYDLNTKKVIWMIKTIKDYWNKNARIVEHL